MISVDIREKILDFFRERGAADNLKYDTDLFKGGFINSLFALEIVVFLEESFNIKINNKEISEKNFRNIESIASVVERSKE